MVTVITPEKQPSLMQKTTVDSTGLKIYAARYTSDLRSGGPLVHIVRVWQSEHACAITTRYEDVKLRHTKRSCTSS